MILIYIIKNFLKIVSKDTLQENLKQILLPLFEWDEESRNSNKIKLRHLIEKLIRKLVL